MACWVSPEEFGGYDSASFGVMKTWQELSEFERHHVGPGGMANGKRHQVTNLVIEPVSDDEVHVTHDLIVLEVAQEPRVIATGRYDRSVVVRTRDGAWISRMQGPAWAPPEASEVESDETDDQENDDG